MEVRIAKAADTVLVGVDRSEQLGFHRKAFHKIHLQQLGNRQMTWSKARLIFLREVRDQLRDRRTLFMILVLPLVLYPALGLGLFQLTLSFGKQARTVGIRGLADLPAEPRLLAPDGKTFDPSLFKQGGRPHVLATVADDNLSRDDINTGHVNAIIEVPVGMAQRLAAGEQVTLRILHCATDDRSEMAHAMVRAILERWSDHVVSWRMEKAGYPSTFANPIAIEDGSQETAATSARAGSAWSRMFPFLLVMMALTGAFYPAVDLCAGEKERGTMETLLISPATRTEIVVGKFLTIFVFSVATTIVNLTSMGLTFLQTSAMLRGSSDAVTSLFSPPSVNSVVWMFVLMLPLSAFFSALCMALAIFARSTKEGQYYLMPLFLIVTPLVFVTLAPGVELNPFYSLVPVTNVALLLKTLMLNQYATAALFFVPVLAPTLLYGYLALRYAAEQFSREDVLFREAERFDLAPWLKQRLIDKLPAPSVGLAWGFFGCYMVLRWYLQGRLPITPMGVIASQLGTLLLPAVALALLFTQRPAAALNLRWPDRRATLIAVPLVFAIHPVAIGFSEAVESFKDYLPDVDALAPALAALFERPLWQRLVIVALVPAICEEVVFRGLVLNGFLQRYRPGLAIVVSSVLFGVSHMIPQQMIAATLLGVVLAIVATRTGSILVTIAFHFLHNAMVVIYAEGSLHNGGLLDYPLPLILAGALVSAILVGYLATMPSRLKRVGRPIFADETPPSLPLSPTPQTVS
jgi:sodium transport system permease protein